MMLEMMPAKESSEKPIIISSDSYSLRWFLAVAEEDMLLKVRAADCTSFSWFFICWRIPIIIRKRVLFFSNSSLAWELMSVAKTRISNICSFVSS